VSSFKNLKSLTLTFCEDDQDISPGDDIIIKDEDGTEVDSAIVDSIGFCRLDKFIEGCGGHYDADECKGKFGDGIEGDTMIKIVHISSK